MNILVVSLLRLGDILMTVPVLKGLKLRYPNARVHLLINSRFTAVTGLMPFVDRIHAFDRERFQSALASRAAGLAEPVDDFLAWVDELNGIGFAKVVNLTQNRLSARICALIEAPEKRGLVLDSDETARFGSPWFHHLNGDAAGGARQVFHYVDVFHHGAGLTGLPVDFGLTETPEGQREADIALEGVEKVICLQALTSDEKKNWGQERWIALARRLRQNYPDHAVVALGAAFERPAIEKLVDLARASGVEIRAAIVGLEGAYSVLRRARLLVTGDTSIKHLANGAAVSVVEICIGSSDPFRTGIYREGQWILHSQAACAPCPHSEPCTKSTHVCAEELDVVDVYECVAAALNGTERYAPRADARVRAYRTSHSTTGFWLPVPLRGDAQREAFSTSLDKTSWKMYLNDDHLYPVTPYGTESLKLKTWLSQHRLRPTGEDGRRWVNEQESELAAVEAELERLLSTLGAAVGNFGENGRYHVWLREVWAVQSRLGLQWLSPSEVHLPVVGAPLFSRIRRLQLDIERTRQRIAIKLRLLRTLKSQIAMEYV